MQRELVPNDNFSAKNIEDTISRDYFIPKLSEFGKEIILCNRVFWHEISRCKRL